MNNNQLPNRKNKWLHLEDSNEPIDIISHIEINSDALNKLKNLPQAPIFDDEEITDAEIDKHFYESRKNKQTTSIIVASATFSCFLLFFVLGIMPLLPFIILTLVIALFYKFPTQITDKSDEEELKELAAVYNDGKIVPGLITDCRIFQVDSVKRTNYVFEYSFIFLLDCIPQEASVGTDRIMQYIRAGNTGYVYIDKSSAYRQRCYWAGDDPRREVYLQKHLTGYRKLEFPN